VNDLAQNTRREKRDQEKKKHFSYTYNWTDAHSRSLLLLSFLWGLKSVPTPATVIAFPLDLDKEVHLLLAKEANRSVSNIF